MSRILNKSRLLLGLAMFVAALSLAACGTSSGGDEGDTTQASEETSGGASGDAIVLGASVPLSGPSGEQGQLILNGIELAVEEVNANGGVDGKQIELDVQDDEGAPDTATALVDKFDQDGAVAIVGTYNSPNVLAMSGPIKRAGIPHIVMGVSQSIVEDANPWQFQTSPTDAQQIEGVVQMLTDGGFEKVGLLTDTTPLGVGALEPITKALKGAGLDIVASETMEAEATDVSPQLFKLRDAGADVVVGWTIGPGYATIMKSLKQIGFDVPVIGNAATSDPAVAELAGADADGLYFQDGLNPDKPEAKELIETWNEQFPDQQITFTAALGYDSVMAVVEGLKEVGADREALRDFLDTYSTTDQTAGAIDSTFSWSPDDHVAMATEDLVWRTYVDGEMVVAEELPQAGN